MRKELKEKLVSKYPKIFKQVGLPLDQTGMYFGIECGSGWYWLIDNLCECIQKYIGDNELKQIEATQVKEKYGTLRFYTSGGDDIIFGMTWMAEHMSSKICEKCGSTDNVYTKPNDWWISYLCDKCHVDRGQR